MKKGGALYKYSSRIAVGLAASGGLICAACISGLPAVTCKALAQIYVTALQLAGTAGFCGIVILGGLAFPSSSAREHSRTDTIFVCFFIAIGFVLMLGVLAVSTTLQSTINECWVTH
jgi:hypothetical protein